jgi:hypothetical protein
MDFALDHPRAPPLWLTLALWCALLLPLVVLGMIGRARARADERRMLSLSGTAPLEPTSPWFAMVPALLFIGAFGLLLGSMGELLHENFVSDPAFEGTRPSAFTLGMLSSLVAAYCVPSALLAALRRTPRAAAWAASIACGIELVIGCRALAMRWSEVLFFGLMPLALLFLYAQALLREEERASLSIRR